MKRQKTIGIIVFRREGKKILYLLLYHGGAYWNFPKGHQDQGESDQETARRELVEETGITQIKIINGFFDGYDYSFTGNPAYGEKGKIHKKAAFFLGETTQKEIVISDEHFDFGWFEYQEALKKLHFEVGRELLKRAQQFLLKK